MNDIQKKILLKIACDTVGSAIAGTPLPRLESDDPELNANCGCFVTLKNADRLRGCIGQFVSEMPLIKLIVAMAKASATSDPRFFADPITAGELNELDIEISVLSELQLADDPLSLRLGTDGIYIKKAAATGCFLPQVATETGWTKEQFLSQCCMHKAGLPADAWRNPDTKVYLFSAEIFGCGLAEI